MDWILLAQETVATDAAAEQGRWFESIYHEVMSPLGHILLCAIALAVGIYLLLPPRGRGKTFVVGVVITALAGGLFLLPTIMKLPVAPAFFLLEGLAVLGGLGTVTSRSPVYSAIWFASALLAIGAILLMGGAQFLGLATVAVYAGAIVVTFLFVLMLAQPEGHAVYDRIGWGWFPSLCVSLAGMSLAAIVAAGLLGGTNETFSRADPLLNKVRVAVGKEAVRDVLLTRDSAGQPLLNVTLEPDSGLLENGDAVLASAIRSTFGDTVPPATKIDIREQDILADDHVARLGGELFGRHLISIQVAAVLLLVALVGAIAMAIHGKDLAPASSKRKVALR